MKKIIPIIFLIVILLLLASPAEAAKGGKKGKPDTTPDTTPKAEPTPEPTPTPTTEPTDISAGSLENADPDAQPVRTETTPETATDPGTNWEMVGAILGLIALIGFPVGWYINKKKRGAMSAYLSEINTTYGEVGDAPSKAEAKLLLLQKKIEKDFTQGKIDDHNLEFLHRKIEKYLSEIRSGLVEDMAVSSEVKKEMKHMLKDGQISKKEFDSFMKNTQFSKKDRDAVSKHLKKWKK